MKEREIGKKERERNKQNCVSEYEYSLKYALYF